MDKRKFMCLMLAVAAFLSLAHSVVSQDQGIVVGSQAIVVSAYPGRYAETKVRVENHLAFEVVFVAARVEGDLTDIIGLENTRMSLPPNGEGELPIKFYVLHKAGERTYNGDIVISTGSIVKKIPLSLTVLSPEELFKANLKVEPFTKMVAPGGVLSVIADVANLGEGEIGVTIDVVVQDPETGRIVGSANDSVIVSTEKSAVLKVLLPDALEERTYLIEGKLYATKQGRGGGAIASATSEVMVDLPLFDSLTQYVQERLQPSRLKVFFSMVVAILMILPIAVHYRREAERKKRYLESLNFNTIPRPGKDNAFVGKVAETTMRAFMPLDEFMNHTLCAGATGSGKTVAAQVIVEEALLKERAVIVFDPTAQWSGFIRPCKSRGMLKLYPHFGMRKTQASAFNGNIQVVDDPHKLLDIRRYMKPGEITIFCLHYLTSTQIDLFVENTVKNVFMANLEESTRCKVLIVYDEVHRLLPKFGGSGRGFVFLERAAREFRKWGVGLLLISQVLSDFVGEIKANIGTEIQMRTRYEKDLTRIKLKYDENTMRSVVKESIGTGMLQNAAYNSGRPYFVSFRPLLHDHHKLPDDVLDKYTSYNRRIDDLYDALQKYKLVGCDVFDFELELNLAVENLKRGLFEVVDLYLASLEPKLREYKDNFTVKQKSEMEKLVETDQKFIEKSKRIESKIEKDVESLTILKKEKKEDGAWKQKLEEERTKIEAELQAERDEVLMITERLAKIKKLVRDKEEVKAKLDKIRENVEGGRDEEKPDSP